MLTRRPARRLTCVIHDNAKQACIAQARTVCGLEPVAVELYTSECDVSERHRCMPAHEESRRADVTGEPAQRVFHKCRTVCFLTVFLFSEVYP